MLRRIGVAIGPHTWFGNKFGKSVVTGPTVVNNIFAGAMGYAIALSSASNVTVQGNVLSQQSSGRNRNQNQNPLPDAVFIGVAGANCTNQSAIPTPQAYVADTSLLSRYNIQNNFNTSVVVNNLICIQNPGNDVNAWPVSHYSRSSYSSIYNEISISDSI